VRGVDESVLDRALLLLGGSQRHRSGKYQQRHRNDGNEREQVKAQRRRLA
jgi:hypothetical protein